MKKLSKLTLVFMLIFSSQNSFSTDKKCTIYYTSDGKICLSKEPNDPTACEGGAYIKDADGKLIRASEQ